MRGETWSLRAVFLAAISGIQDGKVVWRLAAVLAQSSPSGAFSYSSNLRSSDDSMSDRKSKVGV
jgi:hypothetical protein